MFQGILQSRSFRGGDSRDSKDRPLSEAFCVQQGRALEEMWGFVAVLFSYSYGFDLRILSFCLGSRRGQFVVGENVGIISIFL